MCRHKKFGELGRYKTGIEDDKEHVIKLQQNPAILQLIPMNYTAESYA